jgi:hypothetical protein
MPILSDPELLVRFYELIAARRQKLAAIRLQAIYVGRAILCRTRAHEYTIQKL